MNFDHPFKESKGRSTRIWLDLILKNNLHTCTDWSKISKREYLWRNERRLRGFIAFFELINNVRPANIYDGEIFMKGIDFSYYCEQVDEELYRIIKISKVVFFAQRVVFWAISRWPLTYTNDTGEYQQSPHRNGRSQNRLYRGKLSKQTHIIKADLRARFFNSKGELYFAKTR